MRVLICGAEGQVGRALARSAPAAFDMRTAARRDLDIVSAPAVEMFLDSVRPDVVINAAAYTAVDMAETEVEQARKVNVEGALNLARSAARLGARLIHISTDFVFDGQKSSPYLPTDPTHPLSVYGETKLAGERAVQQESGGSALIVRTAWVYAAQGKNFMLTMLRLMRERGAVRVVADQISTPTAAASLAQVLWAFASRSGVAGTYHWTDAGAASWFDFAVAIAEEGASRGIVSDTVQIESISTAEYPTPAQRPSFSVLDCRSTVAAIAVKQIHWRENLRRVLGEVCRA